MFIVLMFINKVYVPNKAEDLNIHIFNIISGINESKTLTKHITSECECKLDSRKCNPHQKWNKDNCRYECKNPKKHHVCVCEKCYIWNAAKCRCENGKYLASIVDDLVSTCD